MADLPPGARSTPLTGLVARITQAARYVISGTTPQTWFGPFQPLAPMAPQEDEQGVKGRRWDYPTGVNLNYIPRSTESVGFETLRFLADSCDVLRSVIEARKDQMAALDWVIRPKEPPSGDDSSLWYKQGAKAHPEIPDEMQGRIDAVTQFLQYPDRENTWDQWQREWLESVFVIDAPAIWRRRSRDSTLHSLELIDGATIKPLLGADGRRPKPPDPAYQQILHGIPAADYTTEELLYIPWNTRTNHMYGYSKVEQILVTINTAIRRSIFQLNYYTEGSQPDAFMGLPKEWNLSQIKDFQDYMDALLAGNLATRRHLRFVPGEFKYQETKSPPLKDVFDEYLARVICFTFAVAPDPFIEHVSRGAVEKSHTRALEEGLEPTQRYVKLTIDRIILEDFGSPDLEFKYVEDREQDPKSQMEVDAGYVRNGIFSIDEVRIARGKNPIGGPASVPMLATNSGFVPLGTLTAPGAGQALAEVGGPGAQAVGAIHGGDQGNRPPPGESAQHDQAAAKLAKATERQRRLSKEEVEYEHPAQGPHHCSQCKHFLSDENGCEIVAGRIKPEDWCNKFDQAEVDRIAQKILEQIKAASSSSTSDHASTSVEMRSLIKALNGSSGEGVQLDRARPVSISGSSEMMKTKVFNDAWQLVQSGDFKIEQLVVPISSIRATDTDVDEQKVAEHAKQYKEDGSYPLAPLVYETLGKYYILDGHHRVEGAVSAGADSLVVANLRSTKGLQVDLISAVA